MSRTLTILGCGSSGGVPRVGQGWGAADPSNPRNRRRRCSVLVERDGPGGRTSVLVDASPDLREQLLGAEVRRLDAVLFTHDHADHTHGIDDLRPLVIHMRRRMPVYLDEPTSRMMHERFGYCFATPAGSEYPPIVEEHRIGETGAVTVDGPGGEVTAEPILVRHGRGRALVFLLAVGAAAASEGPRGLPAEAFPKPDRPVAEIISPIWATEKERDAVDEAGQIVRLLPIAPGQSVADLGAGSGYHAVRLARVVGRDGRVVAVDVVPEYLEDLRARVAREGLGNVAVVQGEPHDPLLQAGSIDVAILVHMYHEIAQPFAFMSNLAPALRPGARVGIVDLDAATENHGTPPRLLRCELEAVGYRQVGFHPLRGRIGYLAIFDLPDGRANEAAAIRPCNSGRRR